MKTVFKYEVVPGKFKHFIPKSSTTLTVQTQHSDPKMWCLVDTDQESEWRSFEVVGTGHSVPDGARYIGTFQTDDGDLVWHLFEVT